MRILAIGANWIGDAVMTIPALRELRRIFPDAHIALHTRSWAEGIFSNATFIDEIISFERTKPRFMSIIDQSDFVRDIKFDLVVIFPNSFGSALTSILARIPRRIGFNKDLRGLLLTDPIAVPEWKNRAHEVFYYLTLVAEVEKRLLGTTTVPASPPNISLEVSDERRAEARRILLETGAHPNRPTIALGVGSTNSRAKRWPAERFAELNDKIQQSLGANVILVGSKDEIDISESVADLSKERPLILTGTTDLATSAAILAESDMLVSNDMGLAHLAPAVGTRTLVIFGPTNPVTTRPFADHAEIIREPVECSPCMLRDCPIDHRCMTRISADAVLFRITSMLSDEQPALVN